MKWFLLAFKRFGDFRGRSRRREYFAFILVSFVILIGLMVVASYVVPADGMVRNADGEQSNPAMEAYIVRVVFPAILLLALVQLPAAVRRLHDTGRSAWSFLIALIPYIGWGWFLVLTLLDGEPHPNAYGPDPKGRGMDEWDHFDEYRLPHRPLAPAAKIRRSEG